jgi:hypothetical protein
MNQKDQRFALNVAVIMAAANFDKENRNQKCAGEPTSRSTVQLLNHVGNGSGLSNGEILEIAISDVEITTPGEDEMTI